MKTRLILGPLFLCCLLLALGSSACTPFLSNQPPSDLGLIYTSAAQTMVAQMTLGAGQTAVAMLTQWAPDAPTATLSVNDIPITVTSPIVVIFSPTDTPVTYPSLTVASPTAQPSLTPLPPTATPLPPTATRLPPTATPLPPTSTRIPPTPTPIPCDWAQFVKDVTVPDGTSFLAGTAFTKTWRLKNIGSCTWNSNYTVAFLGGDRLHNRSLVSLPKVVRPGEIIDVSVHLIAPDQAGQYSSNWMLSNAHGALFGIGPDASKAFWVDIRVVASQSLYSYDFVREMCNASWRSSSTSNLPCPSNEDDLDGSVVLLDTPRLENGKTENEPALWTRPAVANTGWIEGIYPAYKVKANDHFMADVGCLADSQGCNVTFHLRYRLQGQSIKELGSWHEIYDGKLTRVDVDLTNLAGKSVQFILTVADGGKPSRANAFWLVPSIRHKSGSSGDDSTSSTSIGNTARQVVAAVEGIAPKNLTIDSVETMQWPDTCLGIPQPGHACGEMMVNGYRVILIAGNRWFDVHTNQDGSLVLWQEISPP